MQGEVPREELPPDLLEDLEKVMKRYAKRRLHTMRGDVRFELLFGNERYDRGFIHCGPIQRSEIAGV